MAMTTVRQPITWTLDPGNPVIRPGQLHGTLDARRAGAAHILRLGDSYRMYYWATGDDRCNRICMAETAIDSPNAWQPLGSVLEPQPDTEYNHIGPSFPHVVPSEDGPWLMYFCGWGKPAEGKRLPNTTGLAISDDAGKTWRYWSDKPVLACDRPWDQEATGSLWVLREDGLLRMYYTAIGHYFPKPEGVQTGHGDVIPYIGLGYATSRDGITWEKPLTDGLVVSPRGFEADPYEYIASKPCILREEDGYRLWLHTFGPAYRVRSLVSTDGLAWTWTESGPDGDLGIGDPDAFDDHLRCYACVVCEGDEYRCWYTGNGFGGTGMGYAVGRLKKR